jgi:LPS-assembly lipoprotein
MKIAQAAWRASATGLALLFLAGCGFSPLHAQHGDSDSTVSDMGLVKIGPVVDEPETKYSPNARSNQEFRNRLLDNINPDGQSPDPRYELSVALTQTSTEVGIQLDGTSARTDVLVVAHYKLIAIQTGKVVLEGNSSGINSYPIITNSYATLVGGQDTQRRALESVADDVARRLAFYFHSQVDENQ